ncbi:hypothetical protein C8R45DRAFT_407419 [Mycena sanguinolenta]|nr:hypothetical protein C8R45DRAFT_407419 [Mycena sanguinolenta]
MSPTGHPYLCGAPLPSSVQQPDLATEICYFSLTKLAPEYPYEISRSPGKKPTAEFFHIPYCQISGRGPPPADLHGSHLGDIYLDLSPAQYAAYGRVADGVWKRWYDPQPFMKRETTIVKHPHFSSRVLWCSDALGVSWFVATTVTGNQDRAKVKGLVSMDPQKTHDTRWQEASALIRVALGERLEEQPQDSGSRPRIRVARARSSTSPLSQIFTSRESSPAPVLGKRKMRNEKKSERSTTLGCLEAKRYKTLLRRSIQQLKDEKAELTEEISVLEKHLESDPQFAPVVAESKQFAGWVENVVLGGIAAGRKEMDPSVREYWDLKDQLMTCQKQCSQEETQLEDVQISLGVAISEHQKLRGLAACA